MYENVKDGFQELVESAGLKKIITEAHNRRHPNKRYYIKGEDNREGYIDKKGDWW